MEIEELLKRLRSVSEAHFHSWRVKRGYDLSKLNPRWSVYEQLNHCHSEVAELYQALRRPNEAKEPPQDEIWDIVLSALTIAHVMGFNDEILQASLERVLSKIEGRVGIKKVVE